eukprot:2145061-Rhodomonas_salina.4
MPYVSQGIPTPYGLQAPCAIHSTSIVLTPCVIDTDSDTDRSKARSPSPRQLEILMAVMQRTR